VQNYRTWRKKLDSATLARLAIEALADKMGEDILQLDLRPVSILADYFIIASGNGERQITAMVEEVQQRIKEQGILPHHIEGESDSGWVLMDYGSVVIHVFAPALRAYYNLEELWRNAPVVVRLQ